MSLNDLLEDLPGADLVKQGLADCRAGRRSVAACLVAIARPRLCDAGLIQESEIPTTSLVEPELELYRLLIQQGGDAYSRYNALLRELTSFESALDFRRKAKNQPRNRLPPQRSAA